jgi:plastocyanin
MRCIRCGIRVAHAPAATTMSSVASPARKPASIPHNVTITGTGYSQDVRPGEQLRIPDIAEFLGGPGTYPFYCHYHEAQGMIGVIIIGSG